MTSFAFILGVLPLAIASGAGSASQRAIGTGVMGGMITATVLAVLLVPVFYVVIRRLFPSTHVAPHGTSIASAGDRRRRSRRPDHQGGPLMSARIPLIRGHRQQAAAPAGTARHAGCVHWPWPAA